jgi:hypothetical protein
MKTARKVLALLLGLSTIFFNVAPAFAAQVTNLKVSLSDTRPSVSNSHTWSFTHTSASTLKGIQFSYCIQPSGGCTKPTGLNTNGAVKGAITGLTDADWTLHATGLAAPRLENITADGQAVSAGTVISVTMTTITNNPIGTNQATECHSVGGGTAATWYVNLGTSTSTDASSGLVDEGSASYTIVASVEVTARVDPTFTFLISSVANNTTNNSITTTGNSTFSSLGFGNLTAGTPKYLAHQLNVTTNTENGYTVSIKMLSQMTGIYSSNNVDPFVGGGSVWSTPTTWSLPNGTTPNDNTAWIGANTTGTNVGWSQPAAGLFGPVENSEHIVMHGLSSDNGTTAVFVTYAIEANVFQPADTYTGTVVYNALPTY